MASPPVFLIVDDQPIVRLMLSRACTAACPQAVLLAAGTVADAYHILQHQLITLLLTDCRLPDGTGLDILRAARAQDAALPVMIVSGDPTLAGPAAAAGATAFFTKPFDIPAFVRVLQHYG